MNDQFFSEFHARFMAAWGGRVVGEMRVFHLSEGSRSGGGEYAAFLKRCARSVSFPSPKYCVKLAEKIGAEKSKRAELATKLLLEASDNVLNLGARRVFRGAPAEWLGIYSNGRLAGGREVTYSNYSNSEATGRSYAHGGILFEGKLAVDPAKLEYKTLRDVDERDMEMFKFDAELDSAGENGFSYPGNSLGELHFHVRNAAVKPVRVTYVSGSGPSDAYVNLLRANLAYSGMTQAEFGESVGMSQPAISRILAYRGGAPKMDTLLKVASKIPFAQEIETAGGKKITLT